MKRSQPTLHELFEAQIQMLATTLQPQTVKQYRACARSFLAYLHARFPPCANFPNCAGILIY